jgi:hypothetical protein
MIENWFTSSHTTNERASATNGEPLTIFAREKGLALEHLCKNAPCAPDIDCGIQIKSSTEGRVFGLERTRDVVLLPREHDLRSAIVSCRNISCHLRVLSSDRYQPSIHVKFVATDLQTSEAKIADPEIAVLVDKNVGRLQVAMDDAGRVDILETALG